MTWRSAWSRLARALAWLVRGLASVFVTVFGTWRWQRPRWFDACHQQISRFFSLCIAHPRRSALALAGTAGLVALSVWGYQLYRDRPRPPEATVTVKAPPLTEYPDDRQKIHPLTLDFDRSVAPLAAIGKPVTSGLALSPAIAGQWRWESDKRLLFQPTADWPVGAKFSLTLADAGLIVPELKLAEDEFEFETAPFAVSLASTEFYQDPTDPKGKKLVATVKFSHPVDPPQFERHLGLEFAKDADFLGLDPAARQLAVRYDKLRLTAYLHSQPLPIPRENSEVLLKLGKGIQSARGGPETEEDVVGRITVPGRYSLRVGDAAMVLADNARFEPEQVLLLNSSRELADGALNGKVSAWVLPVHHPDTPKEERETPTAWDGGRVDARVLKLAQPLPLSAVPSEQPLSLQHAFKFRAPVGRYLYIRVAAGVQSFGGYQSKDVNAETLQVQPYPRALKLLGQGAMLSLDGERKIGFMARGLDRVEIEVGRLLPRQLHQLANMAEGPMQQPNLPESLSDRLVERFDSVRTFEGVDPAKPVYDSVDLGAYLERGGVERRGVFLVKLRGKNGPADKTEASAEAAAEESPEEYQGEEEGGEETETVEDSRLILLTDLGLISKKSLDGGRAVFVQSIRTGAPVAGATVELLGRNGQAIASATTDAAGRADLPDVAKSRREKTPLLLIATKGDDLSFLPLRDSERRLNLSRFDVGGAVNHADPKRLSAFLFSDRGLYRPGDQVHLGAVVRSADWQAELEGMPVELAITDPRGITVYQQQIKLSAQGFESASWTSSASAPTGQYGVSLYLAKAGERGALIGSDSVTIREFEPDRMKVETRLSAQPVVGWLRPEEVKAQVTARHLFGAPAGGRRVDGELRLNPTLPAFPAFRDYRFFDAASLNQGSEEPLAAVETDADGLAELPLQLERFGAATYRLQLLARVFEAESGRSVAAQAEALVSSAPYLVGVKAEGALDYIARGTRRGSHWLALDRQLKTQAVGGLKLDWVQHKHVSVLTQQPDGTYRYQSRRKDVTRDSRPFELAAGGRDVALPAEEPGEFSLVLRDGDGRILNRLGYSVAGAANLERSLERNAELQLKLDQSDYPAGGAISVSIVAPYAGSGLITIERDRVYQHVWFKAATSSSVQKITLPKDFEGNGYVHVQFVRDPASDEIYTSPLSYGVAPFSVSRARRTEPVTLQAPKLLKPGETARISVATSQPTRVALFAVDEGILQVARYRNPDPLGFFFQKRALDVDTAQILDLILPEYRRLIAASAPGGDGDGSLANRLNPFKRKRAAPVAYWSGVVDVDSRGKVFEYPVPDYFNGRLRVIAVAVSRDTLGVAEAATEVRGDFVMTPNVPAMVAPGDEFTVSVGVYSNGPAGKAGLKLETGREFGVVGPASQTLEVAPNRESVAEFRLRANAALGSAALRFTVSAAGKSGRVGETISVRPPVPYRTEIRAGRVDGRDVPLQRQLYAEHRRVDAAVSSLPLAWTGGLVTYLDAYPYSCTEQLVSQAIPALLLEKRPELGRRVGRMTSADFLRQLGTRQNEEGGFGMWSASAGADPFVSLYANQLLVEAGERGVARPTSMVEAGRRWLRAQAGAHGNDLTAARRRAWAIYLLLRQGELPGSALPELQQELDARYAPVWRGDVTAAYMAASYALIKQDALAQRLVRDIKWSHQRRETAAEPMLDAVSDDATLLYLLSRHFPERVRELPPELLERVGAALNDGRYHSLSAASLLLGLDAYAATVSAQGLKLTLSELDQQGRAKLLAQSDDWARGQPSPQAVKLRFGREGSAPAFWSSSEAGFDRAAELPVLRQGVEVTRELLDMAGKSVQKVKVGEEFLVKLSLRGVSGEVNQLAVTELLPGGVEPVLEAAAPVAAEGEDQATAPSSLRVGVVKQSTWRPQAADVREDRLVLYGSIGADARVFVYRVRAASVGRFRLPAPFAEAMYDPRVTGRGQAGWLEVVKP